MSIANISTSPLEQPQFIKPIRIHYEQDGRKLSWEAVKSHDSVAILLYHREKEAFVLVKQFRPPVHLNDPSVMYTYELCAGIVDKAHTLEQIAIEEIDEECGYDVTIENLVTITSFYTSVGISGAKQHLFFAEIDESMRIHEGGGIHTESIELEFLNIHEAKAFVFDNTKAKTAGVMFAFYWFFDTYM